MAFAVADWYAIYLVSGSAVRDITSDLPLPYGHALGMINYHGSLLISIEGTGVFRLEGINWVLEFGGSNDDPSAFCVFRGQLWCFGRSSVGSTIWVRDDSTRSWSVQAHSNGLRMRAANPNGMIVSPFSNEIIIGADSDDAWATFSPEEGLVQRDDPGGSCVWAMGILGGTIYAGDMGNVLYTSTDGRTWPLAATYENLPGVLPGGAGGDSSHHGALDIWKFFHLNGRFYGAGCGYYTPSNVRVGAGIIEIGSPTSFTIEATLSQSVESVGFKDSVVVGGVAYLVCGGDPFYNGDRSDPSTAGVYSFDGNTLQMVTPPDAFLGGGPYIICEAVGFMPPLRQFPRDDNLVTGAPRQRGANGPTSRQGSIRQGWKNTYF